VPLAVKKRQTAASNPWGVPPAPQSSARNGLSGDTSIFSTSLPVLPHEKCAYARAHLAQRVSVATS
jgi:hypothetical protein